MSLNDINWKSRGAKLRWSKATDLEKKVRIANLKRRQKLSEEEVNEIRNAMGVISWLQDINPRG